MTVVIERKAPPTGFAPNKMAREDVEYMRDAYVRGDSIKHIATQLKCDTYTVTRYCRDLERPKSNPLPNEERHILLSRWER